MMATFSLVVLWTLGTRVYEMTKYMGIQLFVLFYVAVFEVVFVSEFARKTAESTALNPFDLPYIIFIYTKSVVVKAYTRISDICKRGKTSLSARIKSVY